MRVVDESTLVPDESLSINEGAVLPWQTLMWSLMKEIAEKMGVRTNVPFRELTPEERDMVFHGPAKKCTCSTRTARPARRVKWISPTSTPFIPWRTPLPR